MFRAICIKPNDHSFPTDIGFIAENLLFYEDVYLIADSTTLPSLLEYCDIDELLELLENYKFKIFTKENMPAVISSPLNPLKFNIGLIHSRRLDKEQVIFDGIYKKTKRNGYSRRQTQKLLPYIETISYQNNFCDLVMGDLKNNSYVKQSIIDTIKFYNPEFTIRQDEFNYNFIETKDGFCFDLSLDYNYINKNIPNNYNENIKPDILILNILETQGDIHLASQLNAEIATTGLNTSLMKIKFDEIYKKIKKSKDDIFGFNDFTLSNGFAIRETINSKEKNLKDFLNILDKANNFKGWLKNIENDKNIINEYHKKVTEDTWVNKLPSKTFRWSFFTGVGLLLDFVGSGGIATLAGIGLSAADEFLLDKLVENWKPDIFVNQQLKPFVKKSK